MTTTMSKAKTILEDLGIEDWSATPAVNPPSRLSPEEHVSSPPEVAPFHALAAVPQTTPWHDW